ncbi:MAG TPA: hypothetical protein VHE23_05480, partial [Candidatus Acidoferrales bacterium]|nr:hypothetical protein [Candidatus Acidoferrales bacterium]
MRRMAVFLIVATLSCGLAARADTIVLKNGRRIFASNVIEENGKVSYETSAGRLSLPKSIVDHVERGTLGPVDAGGQSASSLAITPPVASDAAADSASLEAISRAVVHDGAIDYGYLAGLEGEARAHGREASERAALAHHAAAQFELSRGNLERALSEERTALTFAPEQPGFLLNLA